MPRRRVDLREAAETLGTSVDAVRKRVQRGTLDHDKGEDGRVYVYLDDSLESESGALISELRDRVASLERQLDVRAEEMRRKDTIIMNMTEAMKAISPPAQEESSEPREAPVTATEETRGEARPASDGTQDGAQRPWWRRLFDG